MSLVNEGHTSEGEALWSIEADGLLTTTEVLALCRIIVERCGHDVDARAVTAAVKRMKVSE